MIRSFIACSPDSIAAKEQAEAARHHNYPVLIIGPTGTGKELLARLTHKNGPYVVIDCTNLPKELAERELFGHVRGAFTGATHDSPGLIETANGGTAFFDEIGELPLTLQSKLLRLTQENTYRPVGSTVEKTARFRIVAATNRQLKVEVAQGRFREDLYHRLNIVRIELKPLKSRPEDLLALINIFAEKYGVMFDSDAIARLMNYNWPGNVRELDSLFRRLSANYGSRNQSLHSNQLPQTILSSYDHGLASVLRPQSVEEDFHNTCKVETAERSTKSLSTLKQIEENAIKSSYEQYGQNCRRVANALGLSRATVYRRLKTIKR